MIIRAPIEIIATVPLHSAHRRELINHPSVGQVRLNTIMPILDSKAEVLSALKDECGGKPLWLDLKCRQLRITNFSYVPFCTIKLSHPISLKTPAEVLFKGATAIVARVKGNTMIMDGRPDRVVGDGEPINILDPSLEIHGFFTRSDHEYIGAAKGLGVHNFMLSFVEERSDLEQMFELDPLANVVAKIESKRGLAFIDKVYPEFRDRVRLMAAMDDLYINMGNRKADFLPALKQIIDADPEAIAASRIMTSLEKGPEVSFQDLASFSFLRMIGYHRFMLSDHLCQEREAVLTALDTISGIDL